MMKRKLKASALFMVMVLLLTGCYAKLPDIENHELDDTYRSDATVYNTLYSSEVTNLNYLVTSSPVDTVITANVIDALVDYDNEGNNGRYGLSKLMVERIFSHISYSITSVLSAAARPLSSGRADGRPP